MREILIITHEQCVLEIADQLSARVDARVDIVNDFSQGLKEIFFRQPAVVFIQDEIGGITGEKVASQVRALLEGEPIRLVLLHSESSGWQIKDTNFDGSIDISLPSHEIIHQFQQQVHEAFYTGGETHPGAGQSLQHEAGIADLIIDSPGTGDEYKIDSLADVFPAHLSDDDNAVFLDYEDKQHAPEQIKPDVAPIKADEEFSFDSLPCRAPGDTYDDPKPPGLTAADLLDDTTRDSARPLQTLSADMNGEAAGLLSPGPGDAGPAKSGHGGEETPQVNIPSPLATAGGEQQSPPAVDQATFNSTAVQSGVLPGSCEISSATTGSSPEHIDRISADADFDDDISFRQDFDKKSSPLFKVIIGSVILAIFVAGFILVRDWWGSGGQGRLPVTEPAATSAVSLRELPAFIPRVAPDSAYAAAHPGWERREADGLEFLVFRESGRIKAIQVIAGAQGLISDPFLKKCIRETTGLENCDKWTREERDDFLVEKGTLLNKGELAVYRKMPERDIRGFVITFN